VTFGCYLCLLELDAERMWLFAGRSLCYCRIHDHFYILTDVFLYFYYSIISMRIRHADTSQRWSQARGSKGLGAKFPEIFLSSPTVKHTGEVNCAKFSQFDVSAVKPCKQCLQTASTLSSRPPTYRSFAPGPHEGTSVSQAPCCTPNNNSWRPSDINKHYLVTS